MSKNISEQKLTTWSMQAVILAGGQGKRIGFISRQAQKCLLKVDGIPLLEHVLRNVESCPHISQILVISGYQGHHVNNYISNRKPSHIPIFVYQDRELRGDIMALYQVRENLEQNFVLIDGNILFDQALLSKVIPIYFAKRTFALVVVTPRIMEACSHCWVDFNKDRITQIDKRNHIIENNLKKPNWIDTGIMVVSREISSSPAKYKEGSDALRGCLRDGIEISAFKYKGLYHHVSTMFDLAKVQNLYGYNS